MRHFPFLVRFVLVFDFAMVHALSDSVFSGEDFDESTPGIAQGEWDLFETVPENLDWNLMSSNTQAVGPDADLINSDTDIDWDLDSTLADATFSDFCASQADPFSLEARDGAVSCPSSPKEEGLLSPQTTQLFEDPLGTLEGDFLLPFNGQVDETKPAYPGLLTDEEIKERERLGGELWLLNHPPEDSDDPCAPYRPRGYEENVCCERPWYGAENPERGALGWPFHLSLQGCHTSTYVFPQLKLLSSSGSAGGTATGGAVRGMLLMHMFRFLKNKKKFMKYSSPPHLNSSSI